jgi:glycosyltransferase involved in cell wall biosynthesis
MTERYPLVSILVITYNQADIVAETIESCLGQTYLNIEIVVSDDGSSDATPEILRELCRSHPGKIRLVLSSENRGITRNCNAGLAACTGEYVALMGGDDLLLPSKIASQVAAFKENPQLVLSYHPCLVMRAGLIQETIGDKPKDVVSSFLDVIANFGADIPGPAPMMRADAIPSTGFDVAIGTASDWLFLIEVSLHGEVGRINEPLAIYRQHSGNVGQRYFSYSDDFLQTLQLVDARYGDRPGVHRAVRAGGKRFLLGITYRALEEGRRDLARKYAKAIAGYSTHALSVAVSAVTWIPGIAVPMRRLRSGLKQIV